MKEKGASSLTGIPGSFDKNIIPKAAKVKHQEINIIL